MIYVIKRKAHVIYFRRFEQNKQPTDVQFRKQTGVVQFRDCTHKHIACYKNSLLYSMVEYPDNNVLIQLYLIYIYILE